MGVKQLQTFIQKYVPNGYVDVSLKKKCEEFSRQVKQSSNQEKNFNLKNNFQKKPRPSPNSFD